jgi:ferredoxin--NADP+ reductase
VAIVGVGNVMVDVANYCAHYCDCDEIVAIARRGPFEKAYEDKEFEDIEDAFDLPLYRQELERIRPRLEAVGQNPDDLLKALAGKPEPALPTRARLRFRFLASPKRVIAEGGRVVALEVEETRLERKGERINAAGTGEVSRIPCDTVVFAVGDRVDERFGLPYKDGLYVTAPGAEQDPAAAYQVWDPEQGQPLAGIFVVGWARRASDGVVGRAKLDAETGIKHVVNWLQARPKRPAAEAQRVLDAVSAALQKAGTSPVTYADVQKIEAEERARAALARVEELKFKSDDEMLALLRR